MWHIWFYFNNSEGVINIVHICFVNLYVLAVSDLLSVSEYTYFHWTCWMFISLLILLMMFPSMNVLRGAMVQSWLQLVICHYNACVHGAFCFHFHHVHARCEHGWGKLSDDWILFIFMHITPLQWVVIIFWNIQTYQR